MAFTVANGQEPCDCIAAPDRGYVVALRHAFGDLLVDLVEVPSQEAHRVHCALIHEMNKVEKSLSQTSAGIYVVNAIIVYEERFGQMNVRPCPFAGGEWAHVAILAGWHAVQAANGRTQKTQKNTTGRSRLRVFLGGRPRTLPRPRKPGICQWPSFFQNTLHNPCVDALMSGCQREHPAALRQRNPHRIPIE